MGVPDFIYTTLTPKIAPMVYIMMFVNVVIGIFFLLGLANNESVLYASGVLFDRALWGGLLMLTAGTGLYGMIRSKEWAIDFSGIAGFMLWTFASISLLLEAHWYVLLTIGLFHLSFHGYVYLASKAGVLYREAIVRR